MSSITVKFKLHVTFNKTFEKKLIDLPSNENIFQIFNSGEELIYIVDNNGNAEPAMAFITLVNENNVQVV